jgi:hypothetical protein
LLDFNDQYHLEAVALYFARHGRLLSWPLPGLLTVAAGRPVALAQVREEFAALLVERRRRLMQRLEQLRAERNLSAAAPAAPSLDNVVGVALRFSPPRTGSARWHVSLADVHGLFPRGMPGDPTRLPACGARTELDPEAEAIVPRAGTSVADADMRLCRHCLQYTESFFGRLATFRKRPSDWTSAVYWQLPFRPGRRPAGRWHISEAEVKKSRRPAQRRRERSACGFTASLQTGSDPYLPARGNPLSALPAYLCAVCVGMLRWEVADETAPKPSLD